MGGPQVMTVEGPIAANRLGVTLAHEHVLCDLRALWHAPPPDRPDLAALVDQDPCPQDRGPLMSDPYACRPNLLLDDSALAVRELSYFREAGGGALVELTTRGLSPQPAALRQIARQAGMHLVAGCGWYRQATHPEGMSSRPEAELTEMLVREITDGFSLEECRDRPIRPGIIGEIGTGDPLHPHEEKALRAAAQAQRRTGLAVAVHLALWGRQGPHVLEILEGAGADLSRVLLCHLGEQPLATEYHRSLLERGAWIGFDTFGAEYALDSVGRRLATDEERLAGVLRLLDQGYLGQLVLSHDICERLQLRAYGGYGYAHLLTTIRARLRRAGIDDATWDQLLRRNPARLLAH